MHEYQRYREIHLYKSNDATYPPHFHSHCEMMFVEKGQVNVIVDGESYTAKQNNAIFIAPHQIHSFSSSHLISVYVMFIAPVLIPEAAEKFKTEYLPFRWRSLLMRRKRTCFSIYCDT